jgi:hypothetical protein
MAVKGTAVRGMAGPGISKATGILAAAIAGQGRKAAIVRPAAPSRR